MSKVKKKLLRENHAGHPERMPGLAKKLFFESTQRMPWLASAKMERVKWPLLKRLCEQKKISYFDYSLTLQILNLDSTIHDASDSAESSSSSLKPFCFDLVLPYTSQSSEEFTEIIDESAALFLCHLILASKKGHLCVYVNEKKLYPPVLQLWQNDGEASLAFEEAEALTVQICKGASLLPASILSRIDPLTAIPHKPVCQDGEKFYLQKYWVFETTFLHSLNNFLNTPPKLNVNGTKITETLQILCDEDILLEEQASAIFSGCMHALTLITGGPGTGKTYTAGQLIKIFWKHLSTEQKNDCQIILAAPTGKAAANLQRSLHRVISSESNFPEIQAKTLHALLGIKQGGRNAHQEIKRITADLIIVDECSMIDVCMMAALISSLKPGSRLILLGDKNQLPAVEAGSVFSDLIQYSTLFLHPLSVISLNKCLRIELQSLLTFADYVKQGAVDEAFDYLNHSAENGIKRHGFASECKNEQRKFLDDVFPYFPSTIDQKKFSSHSLEMFNSIRILSPVRQGLFGFDSLNQLIWEKICQKLPVQGSIAVPIMITMNDYAQGLFNGETGVLIRKLPLQAIGSEDFALFPPEKEGAEARRFSALLLPKYTFAYCLSVHKSQGSEFDRVILVLPEGSASFGREVFYTAITRARKSIEIYGTDDVIKKTIQQQGGRLSGIGERLSRLNFGNRPLA